MPALNDRCAVNLELVIAGAATSLAAEPKMREAIREASFCISSFCRESEYRRCVVPEVKLGQVEAMRIRKRHGGSIVVRKLAGSLRSSV
jgi:hypothetical protein